MDTNLITIPLSVLQALQKSGVGGGDGNNALLIAGMVIPGLLAMFAAITSTFMARTAAIKVEEAKKAAAETSQTVKEVHAAVNSERALMMKKLEELTAEVLRLSKDKSTLEEKAKN
jgi:hypothetical protein